MSGTERSIKLLEYKKHPAPSRYGVQCSISRVYKSYPVHKHDFIELEFVILGSAKGIINGTDFHLEVGDFSILGPDDFHSIVADGESVVFNNISLFLPSLPEELRKLLRAIELPFIGKFTNKQFHLAKNIFNELINEISGEKRRLDKEKIVACASLLVCLANESSCVRYESNATSRTGYISSAIEYIDSHLNEPIKLADVAGSVNISQCYLSEIFSRYMKCTFIEYLNRARIERAKDIIKNTDHSITEAAYSSGFGSFANFSRKFKLYCGCTPREYRSISRAE